MRAQCSYAPSAAVRSRVSASTALACTLPCAAVLVPRPRLHLIRFHGVLAPLSTTSAKLRAQTVPQEPEAPAQEAKPAECEAS